MKPNSRQRRLDIIISLVLTLFLFLSFLYRSSPTDFMNPGFPILRENDLKFSENFLLAGHPSPKRLTNVYDFSKVTYYMEFHLEITHQVFSENSGGQIATGYVFLSRFSNTDEAKEALQRKYKEHNDLEGDYPIHITDIPLSSFLSKANHYLLWCEQYSHEATFNADEIPTCYYLAVYGPYFSSVRLSIREIVQAGDGRNYSLDVFNEIITRAEDKILTKINSQK